MRYATVLTTAVALALIAFLTVIGTAVIERAPGGVKMTSVEVRAGKIPIILDAARLGRATDRGERLLVRFDDGVWRVANDAPAMTVAIGPMIERPAWERVRRRLMGEKDERTLNAWRLTAGDLFGAGGALIRVADASPDVLSMTADNGASAIWRDGALTTSGGLPWPACFLKDASMLDSAVAAMRAVLGRWLDREGRVFSIGGGVAGPTCWGLPGLAAGSLVIHKRDEGFWLTATRDAGRVTITPGAGGPRFDLSRFEVPLNPNGVTATAILRVGGAKLLVDADASRLRLTPLGGRELLPSSTVAEGNDFIEQEFIRQSWVGAGPDLKTIAQRRASELMIVAGAAVLAGTLAAFRNRRRAPSPSFAGYGGLVLLTGTLGLLGPGALADGEDGVTPVFVLVPLVAAWATIILAAAGRLRGPVALTWLALVYITGFGLTTQLQLAAGSGSERWLAGTVKLAVLLVGLGLTVGLTAMIPAPRLMRLAVASVRVDERLTTASIARGLTVVVVLAIFVMHALTGAEAGLGGGVFQPSELAKTMTIMLLAWIGMWWLHFTSLASAATCWISVIIRLGGQAAALGGVMAFALIAVDDRSPVLLLGATGLVWLAAMTVQALREPRRTRWAFLPVILAALVLSLAVPVTREIATALETGTGYGHKLKGRIDGWRDPDAHPITAYQVLTARGLVADAPLMGNFASAFLQPGVLDNGTEERPFGDNGSLKLLPEVENDFIGVAVVSRFGVIPGIALLLAQLALVVGVFETGRRALAWDGGRPVRRLGAFLGLVLITFSAVLGLHYIISWSNVFGLMPVMGQPMTLVSLGVSHGLCFTAPGLLLAFVTEAMAPVAATHVPR